MNMVGDQGPGITGGGGFLKDSPETNEEVLVILRTLEDRVSVNPSDNDMMESAGCINASFSGHGQVWHEYKEMSICHQRPQSPLVIFRKIMFGTRSEKGKSTHSILPSLVLTARRQGRNPREFLEVLLTSDTAQAQAASYRNSS
jgi:hypothetical protein